jgi:hypothetical protein
LRRHHRDPALVGNADERIAELLDLDAIIRDELLEHLHRY